MKAHEFLEQGADALADRAAERDAPNGERSMAGAVRAFNGLYSLSLTEEQGWAFMVLLKLSRASQGAFRSDDYVDAGAYCGIMGETAAKTSEENKALLKEPGYPSTFDWKDAAIDNCANPKYSFTVVQ